MRCRCSTRCAPTPPATAPGSLAHELPAPPAAAVRDATNRPNDWQRAGCAGWLGLDRLATDIHADLADAGDLAVTAELVVSCLTRWTR